MASRDLAIFGVLAEELARARAGVDELAPLAEAWVEVQPPAQQAAAMEQAQVIDALAQQLAALSAFAAALARGEPAAEALRAISLSDLARRMAPACGAAAEPAALPEADSGDLLLFD